MKYLIPFFTAALLAAQPHETLPPIPQDLLGKAPARAHANEAVTAKQAAFLNNNYETQVTDDAPIVVQPHQYYVLPQSRLNFAGADHASIALTSPYEDLTGLRILAMWAAPGTWFTVTSISGNFPVLDHGGLYAPVFGPLLKVALHNDTDSPLQVRQLSIYVSRPGN